MLCCGSQQIELSKAPKLKNLTLRQFNQCIKALDYKVRGYRNTCLIFIQLQSDGQSLERELREASVLLKEELSIFEISEQINENRSVPLDVSDMVGLEFLNKNVDLGQLGEQDTETKSLHIAKMRLFQDKRSKLKELSAYFNQNKHKFYPEKVKAKLVEINMLQEFTGVVKSELETINEIILKSDKKIEGFSLMSDVEDRTLTQSSHHYNVMNSWRERSIRLSVNPKFRILEVIEPFKKSKVQKKEEKMRSCSQEIKQTASEVSSRQSGSCPIFKPQHTSKLLENGFFAQPNTLLIINREKLKLFDSGDAASLDVLKKRTPIVLSDVTEQTMMMNETPIIKPRILN